MSDIQWVKHQLREASRRRRLLDFWSGIWQGLLWGGSLFLVALALYKVLPLEERWVQWAGWIALSITVGCGLSSAWRRLSLMEAARLLDAKRGSHERLSTALELSERPGLGPWRELVLADAVRALKGTSVSQLLPLRVPRCGRWIVVVLGVSAGLGWAPEYRTPEQKRARQEVENIRETGSQMARFVKRNLETRPPTLEPLRKSMEAVQELGEHLAKATLTRAEALRELASLSDKLKAEAKEFGKNPAYQKMDEPSKNSGQGGGSTEALRKKIDAMNQQLGSGAGNPQAIENLRRELQKARETAMGFTGQGGDSSTASLEEMSKALSDLAKQAASLGAPLPNLQKALEALRNAEIDQLMKSLELAEKDLEKLEQMARAIESMRNDIQAIGKTLAEQLQNGQAEAAVATIGGMIKELAKENLSADSLRKILDEVSEAIQPAQPYGSTAEHLKGASNQLKSGEKPRAGESLAAAAKELQKLLREMAEGEGLMASLEALQKAQMCIGNGVQWGRSSGPPRAGQRGSPGAGVGTWADEETQLAALPEVTERWDNSGVERPDTDSKSPSDRPDDRPDGLVPTKVKGQMNPGAPMPSIPIRGLSVKGQSRVSFSEVIPAAQSQAQSALSQDQVPRAYRGAVRDYFNDLRE